MNILKNRKELNNLMNKNILLILILALLIIPNVSADLGTYKKGTCFQIRVPVNSTSTFANISTITYPNGKIAYVNLTLSPENPFTYNRTYCDSNQMGVYTFDYFTSTDTIATPNSFSVTANGQPYQNFPILYMLVVLSFVLLIVGKYLGRIFRTSVWDTFAGMILIISGILVITEGFNYTDYSTLGGQALGLILLGLGMIITYYSNKEVFD